MLNLSGKYFRGKEMDVGRRNVWERERKQNQNVKNKNGIGRLREEIRAERESWDKHGNLRRYIVKRHESQLEAENRIRVCNLKINSKSCEY